MTRRQISNKKRKSLSFSFFFPCCYCLFLTNKKNQKGKKFLFLYSAYFFLSFLFLALPPFFPRRRSQGSLEARNAWRIAVSQKRIWQSPLKFLPPFSPFLFLSFSIFLSLFFSFVFPLPHSWISDGISCDKFREKETLRWSGSTLAPRRVLTSATRREKWNCFNACHERRVEEWNRFSASNWWFYWKSMKQFL